MHDAVEFMRASSGAAAEAKGNLVRADYHRKRTRARLMLEAPHTSQGMREAWAEAHEDYAEICDKLAKCEEQSEWYRNERSKAETVCEMWRTQSATYRSLGKVA